MKAKKRANVLTCAVPNHIAYTVLALLFLAVITLVYVLHKSTGTISWQNTKLDQVASSTDAKRLTAFVDSGAALIESDGDKAFTEFRTKDSKWWTGEAYLFVYDMTGKTLVLPPTPEVEGTNRWSTKDSQGTYYVREMINVLKTNDSGWLQYVYPKPGETNPSPKLAYFRKAKLGTKTLLVGSGIYLK